MIESSEKIQDIYEELDNADRINYLIKQVFVLFMYLYFRFVQSCIYKLISHVRN